jgi:XisI protein
MDIGKVQHAIRHIFEDITPPNARIGDLEYQWVFDTERHHYQLLVTGWEQTRRIHSIVVQIDIRDDLVWVQEDNTDYGVVDELVRQGIPKNKIVLGWQSSFMRQHSGYATGVTN